MASVWQTWSQLFMLSYFQLSSMHGCKDGCGGSMPFKRPSKDYPIFWHSNNELLWMQKETEEGAVNLTFVKQVFVVTGKPPFYTFSQSNNQLLSRPQKGWNLQEMKQLYLPHIQQSNWMQEKLTNPSEEMKEISKQHRLVWPIKDHAEWLLRHYVRV